MKFENEFTDCDIPMKKLSRIELEEQLTFYKHEVDRKDELIRELMRGTIPERGSSRSDSTDSTRSSHEHTEELKAELELLHKNEMEHKNLIEEKNTIIRELRNENSSLRMTNTERLKKVEQLEKTFREASDQLKQFECAQKRNDHILQSLQNDIKAKNAQLFNLKSQYKSEERRLRELLTSEQERNSGINQIIDEMAKILECESNAESCVLKLLELAQANCNQKTLLARISDEREEFEFAQRAARETISRLSGELNKEQREKQAAKEEAQSRQEDLDKLRTSLEQSEQRNVLLNDRVQQLSKTLQLAREDAAEKDKKLSLLSDAQSKLLEKLSGHNNETKKLPQCRFMEQLRSTDAQTLDDFFNNVMHMLAISKDEEPVTALSIAENRIQELIEHTKQYQLHLKRSEAQLSRFSEARCTHEPDSHLKSRIEQLEQRLASGGVTIDQLRKEKSMLTDRILQIATAARLDGPLRELDTEALCQALIMRVGQLQQNDTENQAKQRLQITRLQRQLKEMKEKAEAFELHVSVLRNRLTDTQERRSLPGTPAGQVPVSLASSEKERRRLAKQLQQTKEESEELRKEIVELKARLHDTSQDKLAIVGQSKVLQSNEARFTEVNRVCDELKSEILKLTKQLKQKTTQYEEDTTNLKNDISALDKELRSTKEALDSCRRSEKQLLDFRSLVACHLGLNSDQLAIPDYQIMMQLDQLIRDRQTGSIKAATLKKTTGMLDGKYGDGSP